MGDSDAPRRSGDQPGGQEAAAPSGAGEPRLGRIPLLAVRVLRIAHDGASGFLERVLQGAQTSTLSAALLRATLGIATPTQPGAGGIGSAPSRSAEQPAWAVHHADVASAVLQALLTGPPAQAEPRAACLAYALAEWAGQGERVMEPLGAAREARILQQQGGPAAGGEGKAAGASQGLAMLSVGERRDGMSRAVGSQNGCTRGQGELFTPPAHWRYPRGTSLPATASPRHVLTRHEQKNEIALRCLAHLLCALLLIRHVVTPFEARRCLLRCFHHRHRSRPRSCCFSAALPATRPPFSSCPLSLPRPTRRPRACIFSSVSS